MKLSKKQHTAFFLAGILLASFLIVFLTIFLTQSAYFTPSSDTLVINGMDIALGPPPNSTDIPLDSTITVDALASASYNDLHVTPQVTFASVTSETTGPLTYRTTFHPDKLLQPATSYTVSVTIMNTPVSWSFTTAPEPFNPRIGYYLASNALWISVSVAAAATAIGGLVVWFKERKRV
jgi:hypothetical protein